MKKFYPLGLCIRTILAAALLSCALTAGMARTVVQFTTNLGTIDVELFDDTMPITVANFLTYVRSGRYASSIIHRSTTYNPDEVQIIQGGGFQLAGTSIQPIASEDPILLESGEPHLRGTIAMALANDPNSATSQWFFNVTDNPGLDGNYAVFGRVIGLGGLATLDAIASLGVLIDYLAPPFSQLPLRENSLVVSSLVVVQSVQVVEPLLQITQFQKSESGVRLDWSASPTGRAVNLQRTSDLSSGAWTTIAEGISASAFIDSNPPSGRAFYRVVVP